MLESNAPVECTRSLLSSLLQNKHVMPKVIVHRHILTVYKEVLAADPQYTRLKLRLDKAWELLTKKRQRVYLKSD